MSRYLYYTTYAKWHLSHYYCTVLRKSVCTLERHRTQHPVTSTFQFLLGLGKTHQFIERTGKPGVQQSVRPQRVKQNWATEQRTPLPVYTNKLSCLLNSNFFPEYCHFWKAILKFQKSDSIFCLILEMHFINNRIIHRKCFFYHLVPHT